MRKIYLYTKEPIHKGFAYTKKTLKGTVYV